MLAGCGGSGLDWTERGEPLTQDCDVAYEGQCSVQMQKSFATVFAEDVSGSFEDGQASAYSLREFPFLCMAYKLSSSTRYHSMLVNGPSFDDWHTVSLRDGWLLADVSEETLQNGDSVHIYSGDTQTGLNELPTDGMLHGDMVLDDEWHHDCWDLETAVDRVIADGARVAEPLLVSSLIFDQDLAVGEELFYAAGSDIPAGHVDQLSIVDSVSVAGTCEFVPCLCDGDCPSGELCQVTSGLCVEDDGSRDELDADGTSTSWLYFVRAGEASNNGIWRVGTDGSDELVVSAEGDVAGVAISVCSGRLWYSSQATGRLYQVDNINEASVEFSASKTVLHVAGQPQEADVGGVSAVSQVRFDPLYEWLFWMDGGLDTSGVYGAPAGAMYMESVVPFYTGAACAFALDTDRRIMFVTNTASGDGSTVQSRSMDPDLPTLSTVVTFSGPVDNIEVYPREQYLFASMSEPFQLFVVALPDGTPTQLASSAESSTFSQGIVYNPIDEFVYYSVSGPAQAGTIRRVKVDDSGDTEVHAATDLGAGLGLHIGCVAACEGACARHGPLCEYSYNDGEQNGDETDVDCGGGFPGAPKCLTGKQCAFGTDCYSAQCDSGVCIDPPQGAAAAQDSDGSVAADHACEST